MWVNHAKLEHVTRSPNGQEGRKSKQVLTLGVIAGKSLKKESFSKRISKTNKGDDNEVAIFGWKDPFVRGWMIIWRCLPRGHRNKVFGFPLFAFLFPVIWKVTIFRDRCGSSCSFCQLSLDTIYMFICFFFLSHAILRSAIGLQSGSTFGSVREKRCNTHLYLLLLLYIEWIISLVLCITCKRNDFIKRGISDTLARSVHVQCKFGVGIVG